MAIIDDVTQQMKEAMRAKEKVRLGTLRSIRAAFIEALKAASPMKRPPPLGCKQPSPSPAPQGLEIWDGSWVR
jgi:hypothetical protein